MIEIFYDGDCKLCAKIASRIALYDMRYNVILTNLAEEPNAPELYGISYDSAMRKIHGTDGVKVFTGVNLLIEILKNLGFKKTAWTLSLPVLKQSTNVGLFLLSKFRKQLGPFV